MPVRKFKLFDCIEDVVKPIGNGGHVTTPLNWVGEKVLVLKAVRKSKRKSG